MLTVYNKYNKCETISASRLSFTFWIKANRGTTKNILWNFYSYVEDRDDDVLPLLLFRFKNFWFSIYSNWTNNIDSCFILFL